MGIKCCFSPVSSLLCAEDCSSILCNEEEGDWDCEVEAAEAGNCELWMDLASQQPEDCIGRMLEREKEHLPAEGYAERVRNGGLEASTRKAAIDWIWKVHSHYSFGPLSICLAVNYLDRFLSNYELAEDKTWMQQLLAVACLSLAVKTEETEHPLPLEMLMVGGGRFIFEARTIQRMELHLLSTLQWRMQSVTPFTFIGYYLHMFNARRPQTRAMARRCTELILHTLRGCEFLQFRPSEIAAAAAMSVVTAEAQTLDIDKALSLQDLSSKEGVTKCYELFQETALHKETPFTSISRSDSPSGVLDAAACLSFKSNETASFLQSSNADQASPASKRRKLSRW